MLLFPKEAAFICCTSPWRAPGPRRRRVSLGPQASWSWGQGPKSCHASPMFPKACCPDQGWVSGTWSRWALGWRSKSLPSHFHAHQSAGTEKEIHVTWRLVDHVCPSTCPFCLCSQKRHCPAKAHEPHLGGDPGVFCFATPASNGWLGPGQPLSDFALHPLLLSPSCSPVGSMDLPSHYSPRICLFMPATQNHLNWGQLICLSFIY